MSQQNLAVGVVSNALAPMGLERAAHRLYRLMGVDSIFVPDHLQGFIPSATWTTDLAPAARILPSPHAFFDPFVLMGMIGAGSGRARIGTGVTEPFRRHPATLAQALLTLDHLTKGKAILGIGSGERENTEPYGMPFTNRLARLEEALTIIRLLWESDGRPVDYPGRIWSLHNAMFTTPLYDGRPPPIWIAAHGPRMLELTGRLADGWFPTQKLTPAEYAGGLQRIRLSAQEAGRSLDGFEPAIQVLVALGPSREVAIEGLLRYPFAGAMAMLLPGGLWKRHGLTHPLGERFAGFSEFVPESLTPQQLATAWDLATPELIADGIFAGTVDDIVNEVRPLVAAGARHVVVWNVGALASGAGVREISQLALLVRRLKKLRTGGPDILVERPTAQARR